MTWYYLHKGKPTGPVTVNDLQKEIAVGRIGPNDLLYQEHDVKWREAASFVELKDCFKGDHLQDNWVLLLKKSDGSGYKQKGPLSKGHILAKLKSGEINYNDHVWRKGLKEWYKISSLPDFQSQIEQEDNNLPPLPDDTELPLDLSEQTVKLQMPKEVVPPIVKAQSKSVTTVQTQPQTQPLKSNSSELKTTTTTNLLRLDNTQTQTKPLTALTTDTLTKTNAPTTSATVTNSSAAAPQKPASSKKNKHLKKPSSVQKVNTDHFIRRLSVVNYFIELTPVKRLIFAGGAFLICGAIFVIVTYMSTYIDRLNVQLIPAKTPITQRRLPSEPVGQSPVVAAPQPSIDPQTQSAATSTAPAVTASPANPAANVQSVQTITGAAVTSPAAPASSVKPEPKVDLPVKPTFIRTDLADQGQASAGFKIVSDGTQQFPISVTVKSEGARALDEKSIYRSFKLRKLEERDVQMRRWGLPFGYYNIELESSGIKAKTFVEYGTQTEDFGKKLNNIKKRLVYPHNEERYNFIKTTSRLENELNILIQNIERAGQMTSWQGFYKSWRKNYDRIKSNKLSGFSARTRRSYVHPTMWQELKNAQTEINTQIRLLQKQKKGEALDTKDLRSSVSEISKLKEQMLQKSLWD